MDWGISFLDNAPNYLDGWCLIQKRIFEGGVVKMNEFARLHFQILFLIKKECNCIVYISSGNWKKRSKFDFEYFFQTNFLKITL